MAFTLKPITKACLARLTTLICYNISNIACINQINVQIIKFFKYKGRHTFILQNFKFISLRKHLNHKLIIKLYLVKLELILD